MRKAAALAVVALCAGCVTKHVPWEQIDGTYKWSTGWFGSSFSIDLPEGWMGATEVEGLVASRDGFSLQVIRVGRLEPGKALPHTKKTISATMTPQEISEVLVDDVRTSGAVKGLKVLENRPATISGERGFRTLLAFRNSDGLKSRAVLSGVLIGKNVWRIIYTAPERYYFDLDLPTFDKALTTFRVKD